MKRLYRYSLHASSLIELQRVVQPSCKPVERKLQTKKTNEKGGTSTMFSIKQVATNLGMSTQAIYKQKDELIEKGYMEKNSQGNWEINNTGFNYLQDKKIAYMQQHTNQPMQPVTNQPIKEEQPEAEEKTEKVDISIDDKVANLLLNHYKEQLQTITNQLQEMTEQRDYFKAKFEEKDNLCNQYMNSHLLPPTEDEARAKQEKRKQNIFKRLFGKGE